MTSNKPSVFIDGEAGTTGLGIRARLDALPQIAVKSLPSALRKDPAARRDMMADVDLVILCLPDDAAREAAALADGLGADAPRLLDASTAHRVDPLWIYGFPEMAAGAGRGRSPPRARSPIPAAIRRARSRLLRPLVDAGLIPPDYPVVDQRGQWLFGRRPGDDRGA